VVSALAKVQVQSDSRYALGVVSGDWKVKANADLVQRVQKRLAQLRERVPVELTW
jgi:hypothetical protein